MNTDGGFPGIGAGAGGYGAGGYGARADAMPAPVMSDFKAQDIVGGTKAFLDSNSYVAKAAFLILVVIVFVYV